MMQTRESAYRTAAASGATWIGSVILVYDNLAVNIIKAGQAASSNNIKERCDQSKHAFLLLGHLESWAADVEDASLSASLGQFYTLVRARLLRLQQGGTEKDFQALSNLVCETRAAWRQTEQTLMRQQGAAVPSTTYDQAVTDTSERLSAWCA